MTISVHARDVVDLGAIRRRLAGLGAALEELEPGDEPEAPQAWYGPVAAATVSPTTRADVADAVAASRRLLGLPELRVAWFDGIPSDARWRCPGAFQEQTNLLGYVERSRPTVINLSRKLSGRGRAAVYETVAHEARHAHDTLRGRRWWGRTSRRLREVAATITGRELRDYVEQEPARDVPERSGTSRFRRTEMALYVDGQRVDLAGPEEPTARQALRSRLRAKLGDAGTPAPTVGIPHARTVSAFVQAATLARSAGELGGVLSSWTAALDGGELTPTEAGLVLQFVESAQARLEQGTKANQTRVFDSPPLATRAAGDPWANVEYSMPIPIGRIR